MNINKFTEKGQEAILAAQKLAEERNHTQLEVEHLLMALVDQEGGVVPQILGKLNVDNTQVKRQLEHELEKLAKASGPTQVYLSPRLKQVLDAAEKEKADIVALSALMTTTLPAQKRTINLFSEVRKREDYYIIVGGGAVSREWAKEIGSDGYSADAAGAVELCNRLLKNNLHR